MLTLKKTTFYEIYMAFEPQQFQKQEINYFY